ncbi:nucleoplasmin [Anolis carolinensis]|uniref:Nucleoplasmin core domain-containing protein n=1 Tax=Anolis carolinensis TaxID=28377 RepID=H9G3B7_ANOCA|nr:PREDICTED: nucleoplasmin ATPase [Anolis carolinensis]XP_008116459.1 PREDICTED: nucleoplasmin ATPase [Anolis carolinensis]|eukprot:XP_003225756.1 PREDICTED: nucleoplasmin ATPase [Anolis carolinensis]
MALESSSVTSENSGSSRPINLIWGCQLNSKNPSFTFDAPEDPSYDQELNLRTICLGENAKDEFNVVEIVPPKDSKDTTPVHLATLKLSVLPMVALTGLELNPPVTFRLKSGSGPVYLAGQHLAADLPWNEEEEDESLSKEDEDLEESSKEDSPVKFTKKAPAKRTSAATKEKELPVQEKPQEKKATRGRKPAAKGELRV